MYPFLIFTALLIIGIAIIYNGIIHKKFEIDNSAANIDTLLKQRYDMIPNLVKIVKGYAKHEKNTLTKITEMRTKAMKCEKITQKGKEENEITKGLKDVFAIAENYPNLKANKNYLKLQKDLKNIENKIQKSRNEYNTKVRDFNTYITIFPNNLIANIFEFQKQNFFQASETEKKNIKL